MAVTVYLGTVTKKENSTYRVTTGVLYTCTLKEACSVFEPRFIISATNISNFNYCYCGTFNRCYFITNMIYYRDRVEVVCAVDVLATYKTGILAGSHYVLRSASEYDENIIDDLYPTLGTTDLLTGTDTNSVFSTSNISYVVGVINTNNLSKFGAVQYYCMSSGDIAQLTQYLLGDPVNGESCFTGIESIYTTLLDPDIRAGIARSLAQPMQYITESFMLPYTPPTVSSSSRVKAGWFTLPSNVTGAIVSSGSYEFSIDSRVLELPGHPQAATRGKYLTLNPYMRYWLHLGPFGNYPIDSSLVYDNRRITASVYGDLMGNVTCKLWCGGTMIDVLHANVKNNFPVAQVSMDVSRAVGAGTQIAVGATRAATGDPTGIVSGISGVISAAESTLPQVRSEGTQGSFVNVFDNFTAYGAAQHIVDDMNTEKGRPLCKVRTLSTLSGYCLCSNADAQVAATEYELKKINNYLNTGFYIE